MSLDHAATPSAPLVFYVRLRVKPERVDEWLHAVHAIVDAMSKEDTGEFNPSTQRLGSA
ncbi:hypothetical protein [uncultured Pseudoxanthomonas sp.]|uniref:hypothetical protein n=1 Tax=uncultured Pseudoxanthomonas sp. TaxID=281701 RepID=UPI00262C19DE|nr:hypothetical protein [uncultured Pseudoxanthomonas sp.]